MTPREGYRTEARFRAHVVRGWYEEVGRDRSTQPWSDTSWTQALEAADVSGVPDLLWARAEEGAGWIEFKHVRALGRHGQVTVPWRPSQPLALRWLVARGQRAGALAWVAPLGQWLWLPAQATMRWVLNVSGPGGYLLWPHAWGVGRVPRPWLLPYDQRSQPAPLTARNPLVAYFVDGAPVASHAYDEELRRRGLVARTFLDDRRRDHELESAVRDLRGSALRRAAQRRRRDAEKAQDG